MRVKAGHQGACRPASNKAHRHAARLASTICQSIQRPAAAPLPECVRQAPGQWPAVGRSSCQPPANSHHLTANGSMQQPSRQVACRVAAVTEFPNYKTSIVEVPRGETAGATMVVENVTLQAGDRDLMEEVNWRVLPGQRWGLVGANGCGKSTLIRALCGIRPVDTGRLIVAPKVEVGFLAQTAVSGSTRTVWEEARSQMTTLLAAEAQIEAAQRELEKGNPGAAEELAAAQDAYIMAGGADSDKRITNVLNGLGFRMEQFHVPATQFSGGWQMRIALARLLLGEAGQAAAAGTAGGLMLLDEPTNHLDSAAIKWLGSFLRASGGTLVVVSHDEALLEDVCDHIAEVRGKKLHTYTGSFSKFLQQRAEREAQAIATAAAQQMEIDRLEGFVKRFGAKASKASSAQSKQKLADKLKAEMVDVPTAASIEGGGDYTKVTLKLPRAPPCFTDVLVLKDASIGWGNKDVPGAKPIVSGVELVVKKGQRVLVLGPNGAGKSTLLKALSGSIPLWGGTRKEGDGVKLGVFSQDLAQDLPLDKTALQYVEQMARAHDPNTTLMKCRQALGALGLTNSLALQPIGVLSGGEKARVALAAFALVPSNVLLLDEASNHLDAATIKVLTGALQDFQGAIVAITHNRAFAESLNATHVLRVQDGKATLSGNMGLTDADFEHGSGGVAAAKGGARIKERNTPGGKAKRGTRSGSESGSSRDGTPSPPPTRGYSPAPAARNGTPSPPPSKNGVSAATKSKRTTLAWTEQQEYQRLGKEVANLTEQRDALQDKVAKLAKGSDFKALEASSLELAKIAEKVDKLEMRWLELAELAGDI